MTELFAVNYALREKCPYYSDPHLHWIRRDSPQWFSQTNPIIDVRQCSVYACDSWMIYNDLLLSMEFCYLCIKPRILESVALSNILD